MADHLCFEPAKHAEPGDVGMSKPLVLFVTGADRPMLPPGTPAETYLETYVAYHVGELVRECDHESLPLLASFLLDATMAVLVGAGIPKDVALRWLEKVAPAAYDVVQWPGPAEPEAENR
jgi:hypothetical protein